MRHANKDAEAMDDLAVAVFRQKLRSLATYTFSTAQLLLKQLVHHSILHELNLKLNQL